MISQDQSEISLWNNVILFISKIMFSSKIGLRPKASRPKSVKYGKNSVKYGKEREIWSTIFRAVLPYLTLYYGI